MSKFITITGKNDEGLPIGTTLTATNKLADKLISSKSAVIGIPIPKPEKPQ